MSGHLSSDQLSEWMIGERAPAVERHLSECPSCRAELACAGEAMSQFRASARRWAETELCEGVVFAEPAENARPWMSLRQLALGGLSAAVLLVAALSVSVPVRQPSPLETAAADAALLMQVNGGVSRTVPQSMEPLLQLVSWDFGYPVQAGGSRARAGQVLER